MCFQWYGELKGLVLFVLLFFPKEKIASMWMIQSYLVAIEVLAVENMFLQIYLDQNFKLFHLFCSHAEPDFLVAAEVYWIKTMKKLQVVNFSFQIVCQRLLTLAETLDPRVWIFLYLTKLKW